MDSITKPNFIKIAAVPIANFSVPTTPLCTNSPIQLMDSSTISHGNIISWYWTDNDTNQNPIYSNEIADSHFIQLITTSDYGCADTTSTVITIHQTPTAYAGVDQQICIGDVAQLDATGAGIGGTYVWTPNVGLDCDSCQSPISSTMNSIHYQVEVTTVHGCTDTDIVFVEVGPHPLPNIGLNGSTITICKGETTQLFASGGVSMMSYTWDSSKAGLSCYTNCNNPFASPKVTTTYVVQVVGQGDCVNYDSITVVVVEDNADLLGNDVTICKGDEYQLNTTFNSNITWSPASELSCTYCPNPIATPSQTTTFTLSVTGMNGCEIQDSITINIFDRATMPVLNDLTICKSDAVYLNPNSDGNLNNIDWTPVTGLDNANSPNPEASPEETTTYICTATNGLCTIKDTLTVFVREQIEVYGNDTTICKGDTISLSVDGSATEYIFTPTESILEINNTEILISPNQSTVYEVVGQHEYCASDTAYLTVLVESKPTLDILPNQLALSGQSIQLANGNEENIHIWTPNINISCTDCPNPIVYTTDSTITYTVKIQSPNGCTNTEYITISIEQICDETLFGLPQAFSPNDDGLNDVFYVRSTALTDIETFRVYNNWGERLFEQSDCPANHPDFGWDGTYNGQPAEQGIYVYYAVMRCPIDGSTILKKGNVLLTR